MKKKALFLSVLMLSSFSYAEFPAVSTSNIKDEGIVTKVNGYYFKTECLPFTYEWEGLPITGRRGEVAAKLTKYEDTPSCHLNNSFYITFPNGNDSNSTFLMSNFGAGKALFLKRGFSKNFLKGNPKNFKIPVVTGVTIRVSKQDPEKMSRYSSSDNEYYNWDFYDYTTNIYLVSEYLLQSTGNAIIDEISPEERKLENAFNPFRDKRSFDNVFDLQEIRDDFIPHNER